jgi:Acetyltransferase (GNAT) domain
MVRVVRYDSSWREAWNDLVARAKNGVFLFDRGYMEYHADRFDDHSLLFFDDDKLIALLPANRRDDALVSHGGLTYGGFVTDDRMRTGLMLQLFDILDAHCREHGLSKVVYKAVPHIYHRLPAEEDLYALFVRNARLVRRDVSSTVRMSDRVPISKGRKCGIKKGRSNKVTVRQSHEIERFMGIEEDSLQRKYGVRPTHSATEMRQLVDRFPNNIRLFAGYRDKEMLGGVIVYETPRVAHAQYIAATDVGKELAAHDCVMDELLNEVYAGKAYFDFGISTEDRGRTLNAGLIENKESFGARAVAYDHYELDAA